MQQTVLTGRELYYTDHTKTTVVGRLLQPPKTRKSPQQFYRFHCSLTKLAQQSISETNKHHHSERLTHFSPSSFLRLLFTIFLLTYTVLTVIYQPVVPTHSVPFFLLLVIRFQYSVDKTKRRKREKNFFLKIKVCEGRKNLLSLLQNVIVRITLKNCMPKKDEINKINQSRKK